MRHTFAIIFTLSVIWLLNSGYYTPLILSFGVISVLFVTWIAHRMDVVDHESQPVHLTPRLPSYYIWLIQQIIVSNIDVVKRIWQPKPDLSPCLAKLPISQQTDMGRVIYANSINLTPGTLTIELTDDYAIVHSLTKAAMDELIEDGMNKKVRLLES